MQTFGPLKWLQFKAGKSSLLLQSALVVFVVGLCFLLGFFSSFPDTVLRDRLSSEVNRVLPAGHRLEMDTAALVFPLKLKLSDTRLIMAAAPIPELAMKSVELAPTFSSLIGRPGLEIYSQTDYGLIEGRIMSSGLVDLHISEGRFDLPLPELDQLSLSGALSSVDLVGQLQIEKDEPLQLNLVMNDLLLTGSRQLGVREDELPLGQLSVSLAGTGRTLQVEQLALNGGALIVTGSGRLLLQQPLSASRLELNLQIKPAANAGDDLRTLLGLLGPMSKDGSHTLQLRGRLLALQVK